MEKNSILILLINIALVLLVYGVSVVSSPTRSSGLVTTGVIVLGLALLNLLLALLSAAARSRLAGTYGLSGLLLLLISIPLCSAFS